MICCDTILNCMGRQCASVGLSPGPMKIKHTPKKYKTARLKANLVLNIFGVKTDTPKYPWWPFVAAVVLSWKYSTSYRLRKIEPQVAHGGTQGDGAVGQQPRGVFTR